MEFSSLRPEVSECVSRGGPRCERERLINGEGGKRVRGKGRKEKESGLEQGKEKETKSNHKREH